MDEYYLSGHYGLMTNKNHGNSCGELKQLIVYHQLANQIAAYALVFKKNSTKSHYVLVYEITGSATCVSVRRDLLHGASSLFPSLQLHKHFCPTPQASGYSLTHNRNEPPWFIQFLALVLNNNIVVSCYIRDKCLDGSHTPSINRLTKTCNLRFIGFLILDIHIVVY